MAIYGGQPPSDYYARQDQRKDDKFRDIINLFLEMKQLKQQQGQFEDEKSLQERELGLREQQQGYMGDYYKSLTDDRLSGPDPTSMMQDMTYLMETYKVGPDEAMRMYQEKGGPSAFKEKLEYAKGPMGLGDANAGYAAGLSEPGSSKESDYDKRLSAAEIAFKNGSISDEEYKHVKFGIPIYKEPGVTPTSKHATRRQSLADINAAYTKWYSREILDNPDAILEWRDMELFFDMPKRYNEAFALRKNDVAKESELEYLRKAELTRDVLLSYFKERQPIKSISEIPAELRGKLDMDVANLIIKIYSKHYKSLIK